MAGPRGRTRGPASLGHGAGAVLRMDGVTADHRWGAPGPTALARGLACAVAEPQAQAQVRVGEASETPVRAIAISRRRLNMGEGFGGVRRGRGHPRPRQTTLRWSVRVTRGHPFGVAHRAGIRVTPNPCPMPARPFTKNQRCQPWLGPNSPVAPGMEALGVPGGPRGPVSCRRVISMERRSAQLPSALLASSNTSLERPSTCAMRVSWARISSRRVSS